MFELRKRDNKRREHIRAYDSSHIDFATKDIVEADIRLQMRALQQGG